MRILQLALLLGIGVGLFAVSLTLGSVPIPLKELIPILRGEAVTNPIWADIVWKLRLPRSLTAIGAGPLWRWGAYKCKPYLKIPSQIPLF